MDHTEESPVILSLCPGVLGLERGLERAIGPVTVAAYVEIEAFIIANLVAAMEQGVLAPVPVWTDIKTFDAGGLRGKIHGIIGGYPCQPFSNAGKRGGTEDPRHIYPYISEIIEATRPFFCFFENVEGHLDLGYDFVYKDLRRMGYKVESGMYSAEEVGAPHRRNRLFILAIREDCMPHGYLYGLWRQHEGGFQPETIGSSKVADTNRSGSREDTQPAELRDDCSEQSSLHSRTPSTTEGDERRPDRWPARPGEQQYDWEEPRTTGPKHRLPNTLRTMWSASRKDFAKMLGEKVFTETDYRIKAHFKSGMGSTVNGYNFREDLLRAYGNSVVEDTAEIAFIDLLNKHLKNHE